MRALNPGALALLLALLLVGGCGGRAYYPDGMLEAGPDLPLGDADAGPDLPDGKPPTKDSKPVVPDGKPPIKDSKPDAPDGKPPIKDSKPPGPDAKPDLKPDVQPPDQGPDVLPGNWVTIKAGTFDMGSPKTENCRKSKSGLHGDETLHPVTLTNKFMMMEAEVIQKDFKLIMGYDNSDSPVHSAFPAHRVNWHQAAAYCDGLTTRVNAWLTKQKKTPLLTHCYKDSATGQICTDCAKQVNSQTAACSQRKGQKSVCMDLLHTSPVANIYQCTGFRLPTEAEWEYAYRAGSQTPLHPASKVNGSIVNCDTVPDTNASAIGWYKKNSGPSDQVHQGKAKKPNVWGLYDMAGNASEWCHDGWIADLGSAKAQDPVTAAQHTAMAQLVVRGGSIKKDAYQMRAAYRTYLHFKAITAEVGFRCVRTVK